MTWTNLALIGAIYFLAAISIGQHFRIKDLEGEVEDTIETLHRSRQGAVERIDAAVVSPN